MSDNTNVLDRLTALERERQIERSSRESLPTVPRTQAWYDCVERETREAEENARLAREHSELAERLGLPEASATASRLRDVAIAERNAKLVALEREYRDACASAHTRCQAAWDEAYVPVAALEERLAREIAKQAS